MMATSAMAGTLSSTLVPSARMAAAISLSTEFLAPLTATVPARGAPARTMMRSIGPTVCSPAMARVRPPLAGGATRAAEALAAPRTDLARRAPRARRLVRPGPRPVPPLPAHPRGRSRTAPCSRPPTTTSPSRGSAGCSPCPSGSALRKPPPRIEARRGGPRRRCSTSAPPSVLGLLAAASLAVGFLNTLFTQTVNFAADEFGVSAGAQGVAGTVVRLGIVFAIGLLLLSDRVGRRRMLVVAAFASPLLCALGAVAPSFAWLTATQTLGRPIAHRHGPAHRRSSSSRRCRATRRAYAISLLALAAGLGAGRGRGVAAAGRPRRPRGWRLIYVVGAGVPRRRRRTWPAACPRAGGSRRPTRSRPGCPRRRFALLAAAGLPAQPADRAGLVLPEPLPEGRAGLLGHHDRRCSRWSRTPRPASAWWPVAGWPTCTAGGSSAPSPRSAARCSRCISFYVGGAPLWLANMIGSIVGGAASPPSASTPPSCSRPAAGAWPTASSPPARSPGRASACSSPAGSLDQGVGYGPVMTLLAIGPAARRGARHRVVPRDRPPRAGADQPRRTAGAPTAPAAAVLAVTGGARRKPATADATLGVGALQVVPAALDPLERDRSRDRSPPPPAARPACANGSRVPWTNRPARARRGRCSMRSWSGLPGGCSG